MNDSILRAAEVQPLDQFNRELVNNVHPPTWVNPTASGRYNIVVIGGGTAGLVSAVGAAGLGAKVALIERKLLGGDCLNVGCVASKAIIAAANRAAEMRSGVQFGIHASDVRVDFPGVMRRMRSLRAAISHHDSADRLRKLGIDVFIGEGRFSSARTIQVEGQTLKFKRAIIATGSRPARLSFPGLEQIEPLTNENLFSLTELPARLTVIGGGPIGCEMAHAFARLGSTVTLIERSKHVLSHEDPEAALMVQASMVRDGVRVVTDADVVGFETRGRDKITRYRKDESEQRIAGDQVLIAIGRSPNVTGIGLENASIRFDEQSGVDVSDRMRTSNPSVFAAGDVASKYRYTHAADFLARTVIANSLFFGRSKASRLVIPRATYTSPELAHVGWSSQQAAEHGVEIDTFTQSLSDIDRAILQGQTDGFVRVHVKKGTDTLVGATIVAESAGELINELTMAMTHSIGLKKIGSTIHPYPTQSEAIRKLGDQYNQTRLTPFVSGLINRWLRWTR